MEAATGITRAFLGRRGGGPDHQQRFGFGCYDNDDSDEDDDEEVCEA